MGMEGFNTPIVPQEKTIEKVEIEIDFSKLDETLKGSNFSLEKFNKTKEMIGEFKTEIDRYNPEDRQRIVEALTEMLKLHYDQSDRPDGSPYVNHPLEVAMDVIKSDSTVNPDLAVASLLHDTVEDQGIKLSIDSLKQKYGPEIENLSPEDLEETYGKEIRDIALSEISKKYNQNVAGLVGHLSNPDFDAMLELPEYQGKTKNELYKEHVEEAIKDPNVLSVKFADFSKNALSLDNLPDGPKKEKLKAKYIPVIKVFIERFKDESLPISNREDIINKLSEVYAKLTEEKPRFEKIDRKAPEIMEALANAQIFKKQGHVQARQAVEGEQIITTLASGAQETVNTAKDNEWVMTNPSGEQYIISKDKFFGRYEPTKEEGVYQAKGYCKAIKNPYGKPIEIMASWGSPQTGDENCMIADVCDEKGENMGGEPYIIEAKAFIETYA